MSYRIDIGYIGLEPGVYTIVRDTTAAFRFIMSYGMGAAWDDARPWRVVLSDPGGVPVMEAIITDPKTREFIIDPLLPRRLRLDMALPRVSESAKALQDAAYASRGCGPGTTTSEDSPRPLWRHHVWEILKLVALLAAFAAVYWGSVALW